MGVIGIFMVDLNTKIINQTFKKKATPVMEVAFIISSFVDFLILIHIPPRFDVHFIFVAGIFYSGWVIT